MKLATYSALGIRVRDLDTIELTHRERATLGAAARLLHEIRERRNARVPTDWYSGDEDDSDLLFGWRICDELSREGRIYAADVLGDWVP